MKNKTPRLGRWRTESGFRFIPVFTTEHNAQRFVKHVQRLGRTFRRLPSHRRVALKARRIHGRSMKGGAVADQIVSVHLDMPAREAAMVEEFIAGALERGAVWPELTSGLVRVRQALAVAVAGEGYVRDTGDNARSTNRDGGQP